MLRHIIGLFTGFAFVTLALVGYRLSHVHSPIESEGEIAVPVPEFTLTERSGRQVSRGDLGGKVWVASFVFTCCARQCPQVTGSMAQLHHEMAAEPDFRQVTFTVDPERDTPAVLAQYAQRHGADAERWLFLTGPQEKLYSLIESGFLLAVKQNKGADRTPGNEVTHSFKLALVDRRGRIRGYFDGRRTDDQGMPVDELTPLKRAITALLREPA